jgi:hypothetical protein
MHSTYAIRVAFEFCFRVATVMFNAHIVFYCIML